MKKISLLLITAVLTSLTSYSQDKPYRVGLTFGLPNLVGLNLEYVSPALNNKLAASLDYSSIKLKDGEIVANPINVKSKGDKTTVSIRPERALINPSEKMDNNYKGKIEEVIYHGDHTRVRLNVLGNSEFILKVPNSTQNLDIKLGNICLLYTSDAADE